VGSAGAALKIVSQTDCLHDPEHARNTHVHWQTSGAGEPFFFIHSPILDENGRLVGIDLAAFSMQPVQQLLSEFHHHGESYRAYLAYNEEGEMYSVFPESSREPVMLFDGDRVLKSSAVEVEGLYFVTSAEKSELFAATRALALNLLLTAMAVFAGGLLAIWLFLAPVRKKLLQETEENVRISSELARQNIRFRKSIDFSPVPVALTDSTGKILYLNKKFTEVFGYDIGDLPSIGQWWPRAYPDPAYREEVKGSWDQRLQKVLEGEEFPPQESNVTCKDGTIRTISFRFSMLGEEGMTIFYDITERKRMEAELFGLNRNLEARVSEEMEKREAQEKFLLQQSRLAMMGEMISMIAHQWRQPLNALGLIIQEIKDARQYGELDDAYLDEVTVSAMKVMKRMSATIDDFRNFFSPEKTKASFPVSEAIRDSLEMIGPTLKNDRIELKPEIRQDVEVVGFRNEFTQVLLNLIGNAGDAIKKSGSVRRMITVVLEETEEGKARVIISDTGGGISEENLPRIFDPYFTTKHHAEGTGLGLYMSKMIIEKNMGGTLSVDGGKEGAVFTVEL